MATDARMVEVTSSQDYEEHQLDGPVHPGALGYVERARVREALCFGDEFSLAPKTVVGTRHVWGVACAIPPSMELRVRGGQSSTALETYVSWMLSCFFITYL